MSEMPKHESNDAVLQRLAWIEKRAELACRVASEDVRDPECRLALRALARRYAHLARDLRILARHFCEVDARPGAATPCRVASPMMLDGLEERSAAAALSFCLEREDAAIDGYRYAEQRGWPELVAAALTRNRLIHASARRELAARGARAVPEHVLLRAAGGE